VCRCRDRARLWDAANVLCLSLRGTSEALASEILEVWFATDYRPNPEDDACLDEVRRLENDYRTTGPRTE
jgi:ribose 5-phosphate isomerase B